MHYSLLLLMTFIGAIASFFLKNASNSKSLVSLFKNTSFYFGGFLYFCASSLNIIVLRKLDYSVVLPLTSITYIWTMMISGYVLNEKITMMKIMGLLMIVFGSLLVTI